MAPRRWEYRATSASSIRGRHELVMTAEGHSRRRQRHKFCTILGDEVTVLHLVRFGKRAGPKLERRKAFEYPVWTVPTPYLIWAHFLGPGGACVSREKHQASSGAVIIFFFSQCVPYGHRVGFGRASRSMAASRADSARRGNIIRGIIAAFLLKGVDFSPISRHVKRVVCMFVLTSYVIELMVRHIVMGRLRDGQSRRLADSRFLSWPPRPTFAPHPP